MVQEATVTPLHQLPQGLPVQSFRGTPFGVEAGEGQDCLLVIAQETGCFLVDVVHNVLCVAK